MKKYLKNIIAFLITVFFTILVIKSVDFRQTKEAFRLFNLLYLIFLVPFFWLITFLRAKRWDILLGNSGVNLGNIYEIYVTSNLLNVFLPARAGDVFRGCYFGHKYGFQKLKILGSVAAERIIDGLTVVVILFLGILLYGKSRFVMELAGSAAFIFFFSFLFVLWIYKKNKCDYICESVKTFAYGLSNRAGDFLYKITDKLQPMLVSFVKGFESFADAKILSQVLFFSILSWAGDCIFMYVLVLAFGIKINFVVSFFIVSFTALSTIIPSSSIYVGLYQYAYILALGLFGVSSSAALSISLVQQGIFLFAYILVAVIFIIKNNLVFMEIKKKEVDTNGKNT